MGHCVRLSACKSNGFFFGRKNQLDALCKFTYILVDVESICSWPIPVNRIQIKPTVFYAANAWNDMREKLKIKFTLTWCRCININAWKTHTLRFNYKPKLCQNAALTFNGMHLNIPSTECWWLCRTASNSGTAWMGNAYARSLAPWAILSISGNDDTTSHHQTFWHDLWLYSSFQSMVFEFHRYPVTRLPQTDMHWITDLLT